MNPITPSSNQYTTFRAKRTDQPPVLTELGHTGLDVADRWSVAPRLLPAIVAGSGTFLAMNTILSSWQASSSSLTPVLVSLGISAAAAITGGIFGPSLANGADKLGQSMAGKLGVSQRTGGIAARVGLSAATLAAGCALPGISHFVLGCAGARLLGAASGTLDQSMKERQGISVTVEANPEHPLEVGQEFLVQDKGQTKTFSVTRIEPNRSGPLNMLHPLDTK